jgi:hypothetical protein
MTPQKANSRFKLRRVLDIRRYNCLAAPATISAPATPRAIDISYHRVGKSGSVHISGLPKGTRVTVARASAELFIVSPLPEEAVRSIAQALPEPQRSPYAALSEQLGQRQHASDDVRRARTYSGVVRVPEITPEQALANADLQRPRRRAR